MLDDKSYWRKVAAKIIRTEMAKRDLTYLNLTEKLQDIEVTIDVNDLRGRISRGSFSAALFIQCLRAMDIKNLFLEESLFE